MRDITPLFESELYSFEDRPGEPIPDIASGLYSIWRGKHFLYVGIAGRDLNKPSTRKVRGLKDRLRAHWKGGLGGDQFAVYVFERLLAPEIKREQLDAMGRGELTLNELNRSFIRDNLSYRFLVTDTYSEAMDIESQLKSGSLENYPKPYLNPT
tara:strand:+ start:687 stop:1148 length:462 start_codon:yes stop_codon:yes gene_type:complete